MYICINGHRSASCIHVEGRRRMCLVPGCQAEVERDDDAGLAAALEQADAAGYRRGVEVAQRMQLLESWGHKGDGAADCALCQEYKALAVSLLSAPEAGDRYREVRKAFVAGAAWGFERGSYLESECEAEALVRWPLSEPTGEVNRG